ncbi:MAG: hypothetical protein AAB592_01045 [Patescibacteria group bacterium]
MNIERSELGRVSYQADATTYHPSGKFNLLSFLYLPIAILIVSLLGFIYVFIVNWNPFVYINVLINIIYGGIAGIALWSVLHKGKVRSSAVSFVFGAILILTTIYSIWVWYVYIITGYTLFTFSLKDMAFVAAEMAALGPWKIGSTVIIGWQVYAVWAVEAGLIACMILFILREYKRDNIFCERCEEWATKLPPITNYEAPENSNLRKDDILRLKGEPLLHLEKKDKPSPSSVGVTLFHCLKKEHQFFFVSATREKGLLKDRFSVIHLKINEGFFEKMRNKFI